AVAWVAASAAWADVPSIQARYGVTAAAMLTDDGPTHDPLVRLSITDEYEDTVDCSSLASPSHAAAAAPSEADPGPADIPPRLNLGRKSCEEHGHSSRAGRRMRVAAAGSATTPPSEAAAAAPPLPADPNAAAPMARPARLDSAIWPKTPSSPVSAAAGAAARL